MIGLKTEDAGLAVRLSTETGQTSRLQTVELALRTTQNPSVSTGEWVALSEGIKGTPDEDDRSPPSNAEIKNAWVYTSTSHHGFK